MVYPEVIQVATGGSVPSSRLVGIDFRAWHRSKQRFSRPLYGRNSGQHEAWICIVDLPVQCRRYPMSNPASEALRASDLDDDRGSNLRRICLTRLFAMLARFDRKSVTDIS